MSFRIPFFRYVLMVWGVCHLEYLSLGMGVCHLEYLSLGMF